MRIEEIPASPKKPKVTRVAAYARVSSDKDAAGFPARPSTARSSNACYRTAGRVRLILSSPNR